MRPNSFYRQIPLEGLGLIELLKADSKWWGFVRVETQLSPDELFERIKEAHELAIRNGCEFPPYIDSAARQDFPLNVEFIRYDGCHLRDAELISWDHKKVYCQREMFDTPEDARAANPGMNFCFSTKLEYPTAEQIEDAITGSLRTFYDNESVPPLTKGLRESINQYVAGLEQWGRHRRVVDWTKIIEVPSTPPSKEQQLINLEEGQRKDYLENRRYGPN